MRPIQGGDLVMVVGPQPCCGSTRGIGVVFRVAYVHPDGTAFYCDVCSRDGIGPQAHHYGEEWFGLSRLIRIDPPALPERVETEREVVA